MTDVFANAPCAKGPVLFCLDEISYRHDARALLTALRDAIEGLRASNFRGLEKVFEKFLFDPANFGANNSLQATSFLQQYWFDDRSPTAFFPSFQPMAPIYAEGVLKTLELSLGGNPDPLPIDAWWVMGLPHVELINLVNGRQVSLLIMTPMPPPAFRNKVIGDRAQAWSTVRGIVTRKI
jgi:hypothetical protein